MTFLGNILWFCSYCVQGMDTRLSTQELIQHTLAQSDGVRNFPHQIWGMNITRSHLTEVNWRVVFCKIIRVFVCPSVPTLWFYAQVFKTFCRQIIYFERCCWLLVVQWKYGWSHDDNSFSVVKISTCFILFWRGYDIMDCLALCEDRNLSLGGRLYFAWWCPITHI